VTPSFRPLSTRFGDHDAPPLIIGCTVGVEDGVGCSTRLQPDRQRELRSHEPRPPTVLEPTVRLVLPLFFLSGASALIYQVTWIRQLARIFGSTMQSSAAGTGAFMAGLGFGAWLGGRWVDRAQVPALRAYGLLELGIAVCGLLLAVGLPSMSWAPSWALAANGWSHPADLPHRLALTLGIVGVPAALMGATGSILARRVLVGHLDDTGWRIGLLFGANTLGAAFGALATDLWLVPALGLLHTQLVAVAIGIVAGIGALVIRSSTPPPTTPPPTTPPPTPDSPGPLPWRFATALGLSGVAAMGLEVIWFRFLSSALGAFRAALSVTLAVVLVGLWAGAVLAGLLHRRFRRPALLFGIAQVGVALLVLTSFALFDSETVLRDQLRLSPNMANLSSAARLVLAPSIAMGMSFPLANAAVQSRDDTVGRQVGLLFGASATGNLVGAIAVGFIALPALGIQHTIALLATASIAAAVLTLKKGQLAVGIPAIVGVLAFVTQPEHATLYASFPAGRLAREGVLTVHEDTDQTIIVTGSEDGPARLWTNGHPMSSTSPHAQRYMRFMAHLPLLLQEHPKRALVICFGVGNTTHAVSLHPSIESLHVADLSESVLEHAHWFQHSNHGVLSDPRVRVFVDDGRRVLANEDDVYDLVTLEPPPIGYAGVSALYSRELYQHIRARLSPTGAVSQWLPAYQIPAEATRSLVRAFVDVFPEAVLFVADRRELVLVAQGPNAPPVSAHDIQRRLDLRPSVGEDLAAINLATADQLIARFAGTDLAQATQGAPAVTDNTPILEYAQANQVTSTQMPPELFAPDRIKRWCSDCEVPTATYQDDEFLRFSNLPH